MPDPARHHRPPQPRRLVPASPHLAELYSLALSGVDEWLDTIEKLHRPVLRDDEMRNLTRLVACVRRVGARACNNAIPGWPEGRNASREEARIVLLAAFELLCRVHLCWAKQERRDADRNRPPPQLPLPAPMPTPTRSPPEPRIRLL